ncbi:alginate O-acetyltransferase AlgX-related protein [Herbiconiux ginsengi]|uniref:SGNH hydrolase-like domain-containing protein, acetyltransferase AlgX n=1 Tax=Herbiconiux ginsengi TaxID=381665 RepID=A0A1H3STU4_9MICO|nr:hypothetical protein [Herbiconiux ginsengi]SDZ41406.1 SGNH hydrolase-like domain-containing protein, acetyltransferase AlgX [Herbiconiux ginsengi]
MSDSPKRPRRDQARRIVVFPLVAALVVFFLPAVAYAVGVRAQTIDNRPLAAFPTLDDGWNALPKLQAWAIDHLPLRGEAVTADTQLSQALFNEAPKFGAAGGGIGVAGVGSQSADGATAGIQYPQVIQGSDGWLYFGSDAASPCQPEESVSTIVDGFQTLSDAATASGRKLVIVVAPDKSTIHPEHLPDQFAGKTCMLERKAEFSQAMTGLKDTTVIDMVTPLKSYEQANPGSVWRKDDTHWTPQGSMVFTQQLLQTLDPSLLQSAPFTIGAPEQEPGDLSHLVGEQGYEAIPPVTVDRPGVALSLNGKPIAPADVLPVGYSPINVRATSTDAPLYQPRTVLLGDSFFDASRSLVAPFFADFWYVHNMSGDIPGATATLGGVLKDTQTVVYEVVERSAASGDISYEHPDNMNALAKAMLDQPYAGPAVN